MKLTRERKIYAGLMVAAISALLADQVFFLDSPASADAAPVAPPLAQAAAVVAVPAVDSRQLEYKVTELNAANSLAHRLAAVARQHELTIADVDNAFEPSTTWIAEPIAPPPAPLPSPATQFEARHKLTAVVTNARGGLAMVDGKPLEIGQELEQFVLIAVTPTTAVFRSGDATAVLQLNLPDAAELSPR